MKYGILSRDNLNRPGLPVMPMPCQAPRLKLNGRWLYGWDELPDEELNLLGLTRIIDVTQVPKGHRKTDQYFDVFTNHRVERTFYVEASPDA